MKTIHQWIDTLPEQQMLYAKSNMARFPYAEGTTLVNNLQSAILRAFIWGRGHGTAEYWGNIYSGNNKELF